VPNLPSRPTQTLPVAVAVRNQTVSLLAKFEFVILEEAHEASGNSYFEILRHCKNAHYRLALTGTPFMKEDEEANMRLMASSGPIAIKVSEKTLIDRGILAKPYFKIFELLKKPEKLLHGTSWQSAYRLGIVNNEERNNAIIVEVARAASYGLSSMVLIQHKKHGEILQVLLEKRGLAVDFIQGENDQNEKNVHLTSSPLVRFTH
jgi:superfamily II DNA or RNA helicase